MTSQISGAKPEHMQRDFGPFGLRPRLSYVFGGFIRREAQASGPVRMSLRSVSGARYQQRTMAIQQGGPEWELVWECFTPPEDSTRFMFRAIDAERVKNGRILVDDLFLCPVQPLMRIARIERERANR